MNMFKCNGCDHEFEEPIHDREYLGDYGSAPYYGDIYCCPACCSAETVEGNVCTACGKFFEDCTDLASSDICRDCINEMYTTEIGLQSIISGNDTAALMERILSFDELKLHVSKGGDSITIDELSAIIKEFCMEDIDALARELCS